MNEVPDGQFQTYTVKPGGYIRDTSSAPTRGSRKLVEHLCDEQIERLPAAGTTTARCTRRTSAPPRDGSADRHPRPDHQGLDAGQDFEGRNVIHQKKKMREGAARPSGTRSTSTCPTRS